MGFLFNPSAATLRLDGSFNPAWPISANLQNKKWHQLYLNEIVFALIAVDLCSLPRCLCLSWDCSALDLSESVYWLSGFIVLIYD
mgnify:CR=1 FL=1